MPHDKLRVFSPRFGSNITRGSDLWSVYQNDRGTLDANYGSVMPTVVPIGEFEREATLAQCYEVFPWDCAWFDCLNVSFAEGQRCGLMGTEK